jgi:hypothetical protein
MDQLPDELAKMEYERLSKEIETIQTEANQLATYAVIAVVAICSVIVTKRPAIERYFLILKFLPFITVALFCLRVGAQYRRLMAISEYFENYFEKEILKKQYSSLGWEYHLNKNIRNTKSFIKNPSKIVGIFWGVLMILSIAFIFIA